MSYSLSTVVMTILTSNLLIAVIVLCCRDRKIMLSVGYKLLLLFLALTTIRFVFPFELPFAKNIYFFGLLAEIVASIRHPYVSWNSLEGSLAVLLGCLWLWGTVRRLFHMHQRKAKFRRFVTRYGKNVSNKEPYRSMMAEICGKRKNPLWVVTVPYYGTPLQYGTIRPYIVLPETLTLSEEELYYVLRHEVAHFYHRDALIKDLITFICAVYWWNPLCRILQKKADILLEMQVDHSLIRGDGEIRETYCQILDNISSKLQGDPSIPGAAAAISMATARGEDLQCRQEMMRREDKKPQRLLFCALAGFVTCVYICSYCFILEPISRTQPAVEDGVYLIQNNSLYAVPREDGSYDIYLENFYDEGVWYQGNFIENVDNLEYYIGISIREE